jgi:hypothetical protein
MRRAGLVSFILLLLCSHAFAQDEGASENHGLVVRGQVTGLEVVKTENAALFYVKLNVKFANEGTEPIILFKPLVENSDLEENRYWLGVWSLYKTEEDAKTRKAIFTDGYFENVIPSDYYRSLAEKLDVKSPPDEGTKILQPSEVWEFPDDFRIYFEAEKNTRIPELKTWGEMQEFPPRLWLTINYELLPWNLENFRPDLIQKLKNRWSTFGIVLVEKKKEGRFNSYMISSEPMPIDFSQAKAKGDDDGH